jgi:protein SCO1
MRRLWFVVLAALGALLLASCGGPAQLSGAVFQQPRQLDFTLTEAANGRTLRAADLDGKVTLVVWGYTFCPDVCPTTLSEFKRVKDLLGATADDVAFVMITVDPERDTPERLAQYVAAFDESFIGLYGDPATIAELTGRYGIVAEKRELEGSSAGYLVDHTAMSFLIDKQGNIRTGYALGTDPQLIADDVRTLLAE